MKINAIYRLRAAKLYTERPSDAIYAKLIGAWFFGFHLVRGTPTEKKDKDFPVRFANAVAIANAFGIPTGAKIWKAARLYTTSSYGRMNNSLREGNEPAGAILIDQYLAAAKKTSPATLYRGVGGSFFRTLKPGQILKDLAFMSAISSEAVAAHFAKRKALKGGVLQLTGVKAKVPYGNGFDEAEYIFPRGSTFKVVSVDGGTAVLKALTLPYAKVKKLPWTPVGPIP